jgi:branched-chain amino acid transport system ATP-binding protein
MLKINDLRIFYGKAAALKGVSLYVDDGEIVALIGNNGAGKTTLLNAISGLVNVTAGEISFNGENITRMPADRIVGRGIIHVPEGRRIFPRLTVRENLRLGAYTRGRVDLSDDYERAFSLFPILKERIHQLGGTLSGGEQQMLAVARALMARPKLLLLDEPSLGLAPVMVEIIFKTILEIHQQGIPVLLVEQNAYVALTTAQRAYVLETGNIALSGMAAEMLENREVQNAYLGGRAL